MKKYTWTMWSQLGPSSQLLVLVRYLPTNNRMYCHLRSQSQLKNVHTFSISVVQRHGKHLDQYFTIRQFRQWCCLLLQSVDPILFCHPLLCLGWFSHIVWIDIEWNDECSARKIHGYGNSSDACSVASLLWICASKGLPRFYMSRNHTLIGII